MRFGPINIFGAVIVVLLLIPNGVYALLRGGERNRCANPGMNILEQAGRYGCIILMWLPLLMPRGEFGFGSVEECLLYLLGNGALLAAYWTVYILYFLRKSGTRRLALAALPACIFLLSGLLLRHWLLVGFAVLFAVGHLYVTGKNGIAPDRKIPAEKGN